jgi:hypothetical protein
MTLSPRSEYATHYFDADGRHVILDTAGKWLPLSPAMRDEARRVLARYSPDTVSNAVPGIERALLALDASNDPTSRLTITVLGDESQAAQQAVLNRMEELNPADPKGRRRVTINAVGFPTWLGTRGMKFQDDSASALAEHRVKMAAVADPAGDAPPLGPGVTHLRYERLMRALTSRHGGTFVALPSLQNP